MADQADRVQMLLVEADQTVDILRAQADRLEECVEAFRRQVPWHRDIRAELPTNPHCPGLLAGGWWIRRLDQIATVCIHHTLSHSPLEFARWYITKEGGRPSTCYTIWITEAGEILLCNALEVGCWHNHHGHQNVDLSVGLAGFKHVYPPPEPQMTAAITVAAWAILSPTLPSITSVEQIMGHMDYPQCRPGRPHATVCPGWRARASGQWKAVFFERLRGTVEQMRQATSSGPSGGRGDVYRGQGWGLP